MESSDIVSEAFDAYLDRALRGERVEFEVFAAEWPALSESELAGLRLRVRSLEGSRPSGAGRGGRATRDAGLPFERLGEFRLVRKLGQGGMGVVFLAEQTSLGREVALKLMRPELAGSHEAEQRFEREARAIASLRHPNIVSVYAAGEEHGVRFLALELVEGESLDELLRAAGGPLAPERAVRIALDVARALAAAHAAGVIHRDVKPSNVRLARDGRALLVDFGLARSADAGTLSQSGAFHGTPYYASPEQVEAAGGALDARTDVYSLGATLYQCLTGKPPFEGETSAQVFQRILLRDPVAPRALNPAVSRDFETVVLRAMEKRREERYGSAEDLAADLQALLELRPIRARRASALERARKWARRQPLAAGALGLALLAVVASMIAVPLRTAADKRARARDTLAQAVELAGDWERTRDRIAELATESLSRAEAVPAGDPPDSPGKRELYAARTELAELRAELEELVGRADREFASARALADLPEIEREHARFLARLYVHAEREGRAAETQRLAPRLRGTGEESVLHPRGTLALDTAPSSARATALRVVPGADGRALLDREHPLELGVTPLAGVELDAGSYVLVLAANGVRDTLYPLRIERDRAWSAQDGARIPLFGEQEIGGAGWIYVPAGWSDLGPDPANPRSWPARSEWVPGFFIASRETTNGEYAAFLEDLDRNGAPPEEASADELSPHDMDGPLWRRDADGRWGEDASDGRAPEEWPHYPAGAVSWDAAQHYCRCLAQRTGRAVRLCSETEWERAARGADGRQFPWGESYDASFCASPQAIATRFGKEYIGLTCPVGSFEHDESPFGVRDLAGSLMEWCASPWNPRDSSTLALRILRGGSAGHSYESVFRTTSRMALDPRTGNTSIGFRCAADLPAGAER